MRFAALALAATIVLVAAAPAAASDAQVKAAVMREISALSHQKAKALATALGKLRPTLAAATPTSPAAKSAKTLALQGLAKGSLGAAAQVKAEADNTRMDYTGANTETAIATKDLAAAAKLVNKAAALLKISQRVA
jgi:hypothetical protein